MMVKSNSREGKDEPKAGTARAEGLLELKCQQKRLVPVYLVTPTRWQFVDASGLRGWNRNGSSGDSRFRAKIKTQIV